MPVHDPTLSELVGSGYVELNVHCEHCRMLVVLPLESLLHKRDPAGTTLKEIEAKLKCRRCGNPPASVTVMQPATYGAYGP